MTKEVTTTERVIGFAKEFITCILDDHGYNLAEIKSGEETGYVIVCRERSTYIFGEGHRLMTLDDVAAWIDSELYD